MRSVGLTVGDKDYHRSTDDFASIQPEFCVWAIETILLVLEGIDSN